MTKALYATARNQTATEKRYEAWKLNAQSMPKHDIAKRLNVTPGRVTQYLDEVRAERLREVAADVDADRAVQCETLDQLQFGLMNRATMGDVPSVMAVLRILERRAKLLGLDAPTQTHTTLTLDVTALSDDELDALANGRPVPALAGAGRTGEAATPAAYRLLGSGE